MIKRNLEKVKKAVVKKALNGENVTLLARTYRVSRTFIYKWKKRYEADPQEHGGKNVLGHLTIHNGK